MIRGRLGERKRRRIEFFGNLNILIVLSLLDREETLNK